MKCFESKKTFDWSKLTQKQQTIRFSMYAYILVLANVKPFHYLTWEE